ncbi:hypothetical protein GLW05_20980 [Pontibacillus yanchengensis]|uniref:Uncharacterized protein n=1 Tax=Pontibacillus yanchengensis TaxID=462910 RepID=A0A6I5A7A6_9BACI|nr:hypothetical protein [Pontibacillus yanchengensis]MYL36049.1 hypothetical protein [Pontibacillus yanchengensis]
MNEIGVTKTELRQLVKRLRKEVNYYREVGDKEKEKEAQIRMRLVYNLLSYSNNRRIDLEDV